MPADDDSKFSSKILDCVKLGKIDELEQMVKRGASINEVDKSRDQFTPLHCAAYYGSLECLHWLLWKGADTTMATPKGWTAAHIAAIRGQYACLQALIQSGVNINVKDHRGQTTAHLAATHGHSHTLQALLRGGADINIQDLNGWTPVHTAAYHGRLGCLQFLKTAGGKLDECDNEGNTPVHLAAMEGHLHCLKYLLSNIRGMGSILNGRNDQGDTPKTLAEQFFKSEIVEYLDAVEWERDHPEQAENLSFPAHIAAFNGDLNHLKLLVEQGVISINERDDKGCTPAHKAAGQGHLHILQWLIENGANVNIKNNADETPRDVAQRFAQLACSKLLESETSDERDNRNGERIELEDDEDKPKDSTKLTHEQKKQAKLRAKKKIEEIERLLEIARSNYLQLGGKLEDVQNKMLTREQVQLKEYERTIAELENELECERLRREKLEAQLDACRQEIEKSVKTLRDYETKVNIMERYIHTMKLDPNGKTDTKKKKKVAKSPKKESKTEIYYQSPSVNSSSYQSKRNVEEITKNLYSEDCYDNLDKEFGYLNIAKSELMQLKSKFEKYDKKKNGFIFADDLEKLYDDLRIEIDKDDIDDIIEKLEKDGKISHDDFIETTAKKFFKQKSKEDFKDSRRGSLLSNSSATTISKRSVKGTNQSLYSDESYDNLDKEFDYLNLSKSQLMEFKLTFEKYDKKKNGFIDDNDLKKIYNDLSIEVDEEDLEDLIDSIEKEGKISFKTFVDATAKQFFKRYTKEEIKEAFKKFDKNNSGYISQEELRAALSKKGKLYSKEEIAKLVDSVDKNKDGLISIDEFSKLINN